MKALALLLALASCSIDHPSDALACTTQADCDATRTCTNGYCVVGGSNGCPAGCTSCDVTAKTCSVTSAGNGDVTCPAGYHCTITCGNNGCRNVDCAMAASCTLTCSGMKSCDQVRCAGDCAITCSGQDSCSDVDCHSACACDVTCTGQQSCNNLTCVPGCGGNNSCSSQPATCNHC